MDDLYDKWHEGKFDDALEVQDEDYDSDMPLAQCCCLPTYHIDGDDPCTACLKASYICECVEGKCPCVSDYEPDAQHILIQAILIYKALVSSKNAYPDKLTELTWAKQAWWEAADKLEIELAPNHECTKIVSYSWYLIIILIYMFSDCSILLASMWGDEDHCPCTHGDGEPILCQWSARHLALQPRLCSCTSYGQCFCFPGAFINGCHCDYD